MWFALTHKTGGTKSAGGIAVVVAEVENQE